MTKQELQQFLINLTKTLHSFLEVCNSDDEIKNVIDIERTKSNIDIINLWTNEVLADLDSNIIPKSFYERLKHDVEYNIPTEYYTSFNQNESKILSYKTISEQLHRIENLIEIYSFYKALGFAQRNTVLVGANGCGKTSLANLLQKSLNIEDGIVIPAQKLLIFPSFANTPNYNITEAHYRKYQKEIYNDKITYDAKEMNDFDYGIAQKYGSEMVKVMGLLLGQRQMCINTAVRRYLNNEEVDKNEYRGLLDDVIDIWNSLIQHRNLFCNDSNELKIKYGTTEYDAHQMSDGERVIIYFSGRVLAAPKNGIIITDEPELHLHKSIANKLWDLLEFKRPDCTFIYFTHDLDFATSRNCQKGWIRNFTYPNSWSVQLISETEIPEELLLKLIGSRKHILFCEGENGSVDRKVLENIYPQYTIQPVKSCKNVIAYTRAFNQISKTYAKAFGIIDKDFRSVEQLQKLETEGIFSYDVSEIENVFLSEDFIEEYKEHKHENEKIDIIKERIIEEFSKNIESQISFYIAAHINFTFTECHIKQGSTKDKVIANYKDFISKIDIERLYSERKALLENIISTKDYPKLIKTANDKGLIRIVANSFGLKGRDEYISRALSVLSESAKAKSIIKNHISSRI